MLMTRMSPKLPNASDHFDRKFYVRDGELKSAFEMPQKTFLTMMNVYAGHIGEKSIVWTNDYSRRMRPVAKPVTEALGILQKLQDDGEIEVSEVTTPSITDLLRADRAEILEEVLEPQRQPGLELHRGSVLLGQYTMDWLVNMAEDAVSHNGLRGQTDVNLLNGVIEKYEAYRQQEAA